MQVVGTWGRGTGDARGLALATSGGHAAYLELTSLDDKAENALAALAGRPGTPQGPARCKGADASVGCLWLGPGAA